MYRVCLFNKSKAEGLKHHSALETLTMIKFVRVCLQELSVQGKNYNWEVPATCPSCNSSQLWGHGYRPTHFTGLVLALLIKRLRCNACHTVITFRPMGYFRRFQTSVEVMAAALLTKLRTSRWPSSIPRQRGGQWLRRFVQFIRIHYGGHNEGMSFSDRIMNLHTSECNFLSEIS